MQATPQVDYRNLRVQVAPANHAIITQAKPDCGDNGASEGNNRGDSSSSNVNMCERTRSCGVDGSSDADRDENGRVNDPMQLATPHHQASLHAPNINVQVAPPKDPNQDEAAGSAASSNANATLNNVSMESPCNANTTDKNQPQSATTTANDATKPSSSSSSSSSTSVRPHHHRGPRYRPIRTLQQSLFGQVQLAFDNWNQCQVAIKVSHAALVAPKSNHDNTNKDATDDPAATARSQAGVSVLEDVRREARILRLLLGKDQPAVSADTVDRATTGLGPSFVSGLKDPVNDEASDPPARRQQFIDSINKGRRCIVKFYEEVEADAFHYLISEYIAGGDLFSVLTAQPNHKVNEGVARQFFYALCCSVRYLHAHSVAHLDLSLENVCLDEYGAIKLIDFGLAAQHPNYAGNKASRKADGSIIRNASHHVKLLSEEPTKKEDGSGCPCQVCNTSSATLLETDPAVNAIREAGMPIEQVQYLCRPVCEKVHKPGKLGYMSPELYNNQCWSAYKHDIFALGVILYSMLTGRPPFTRPDAEADVWFKVIYTGQWLTPQVRCQPPAAIYTQLSPNALDLINRLIKPQHLRPTIDQVMRHPFFNTNHAGNLSVPKSMHYFHSLVPPPQAANKKPQRRSSH